MAKKATAAVMEGLTEVNPKEQKIVDGVNVGKTEQTDTQRMIELLEAIDWKLWTIYKKYVEQEEEHQ